MFLKKNMYIFAILGIAIIMRLILINQSLWLDEAIGALEVRGNSFSHILFEFPKFDNHPPLYYLFLKFWTDIFGYSEMSLRLPSVIFGLGTIFLTYKIAKKIITDHKLPVTGFFPIISMLFITTSPFHIYYSQEARMYSIAAFFAALTIYSFLYVIGNSKKISFWIIFSLAIATLIFSDYMPIFMYPVFLIYPIFLKMSKKWWLKYIITFIPLVILGILWIPLFTYQVSRGGWLLATLPGWKIVAGGATFKQLALLWMKFVLGRISFFNKAFYYILVLVSSVPFMIALFYAFKNNKKSLLLWLWLSTPLFLGFIASFVFPAFIYFRYLYIIPAFYLLVSWGIINVKKARYILVTGILIINFIGWLFYIFDPYQQREQWREAVYFLEGRVKDDEIVLFEFPEPFASFKWYSKGIIDAKGATDSISANPEKTVEITKKLISEKKGIYHFEYLRDLSDPERVVENAIYKDGFQIQDEYINFIGVGKITYWTKE